MLLKDKIKDDEGLAYVADELELMSSAGRQALMGQPWLNDGEALEQEWERVARMARAMARADLAKPLADLRHQLMELQDICGTLRRLRSGSAIDEMELFEVKQLAFHATKARHAAQAMDVNDTLQLPDMTAVFDLLDPDGSGVPSFYIYDSYHPQLAPLRKELEAAQAALARLEALGEARMGDEQRQEAERLRARVSDLLLQQDALQDEVMLRLSAQLHEQADALTLAHERMAQADVMQAKAMQAITWGLARPALSHDGATRLTQAAYPRLKRHNESQGLRYQPVDIAVHPGTCLVTGANMAGKTMLLKTVACAQGMAQLGMFVPAQEAHISPVDDVVLCIGDQQNEMNGLSSFASEIIRISDTLARSATHRLMILVDEPARTTNPVEGKAIVHAIGAMLNQRPSLSLLTTHYSGLGLSCRRLRVRGFVESLSHEPLSPATINRFMDYSLLPDDSDDVPQEALRIAEMLGCDPEMIRLARQALGE